MRAAFETFGTGTTLKACGEGGYDKLRQYWSEASYPARALIVSEHETDDDVYFILSGRARAATYTDNGKEIVLSELPVGEAFGIFAAIDGQPRSTNVVAVEDSRIARMTAKAFNTVLDRETEVMRAFLLYLVDRIRHLSERMTHVTTLNAEQRLIIELNSLAKPLDADEERGFIEKLPTQQELATVIFSQRESVGRDMSKLTSMGLIRREGRSLTIEDWPALKKRLEKD